MAGLAQPARDPTPTVTLRTAKLLQWKRLSPQSSACPTARISHLFLGFTSVIRVHYVYSSPICSLPSWTSKPAVCVGGCAGRCPLLYDLSLDTGRRSSTLPQSVTRTKGTRIQTNLIMNSHDKRKRHASLLLSRWTQAHSYESCKRAVLRNPSDPLGSSNNSGFCSGGN
jgi:hypothetical protein